MRDGGSEGWELGRSRHGSWSTDELDEGRFQRLCRGRGVRRGEEGGEDLWRGSEGKGWLRELEAQREEE